MNPQIPFETALQFLAIAYLVSVILLLLASQIGLAIIKTLEKSG